MVYFLIILGKMQAAPRADQLPYAGGTLPTRLNSNYACMGLPPDDMIGILTQTNIQNRIRGETNKWHLIQRCSCVLPFKMPFSFFLQSGLLCFSIQSPYKVARRLFQADFPNFNSHCLAWGDANKGVWSSVNWYVSVYLINSYLFSLDRLRKKVSL